MESCQTLSNESFSYRWLANIKPSLESLDTSDEGSFIEMDPKMPPSKRFFRNISQDFKFDFPASESPISAVDADNLFSNGYLMPLMNEPLKIEEALNDQFMPIRTLPAASSQATKNTTKTPFYCLKKYKGLSRRFFLEYFNFLRPLCQRLLSFRSKSRSMREDRILHMEKISVHPAEISPKIGVVYLADDCRTSCDSESSIYEAVLHCKRSYGK